MHLLFSIRLFALVAQRQLIMYINRQGGCRTREHFPAGCQHPLCSALHTLSVSVHAARWAQDAGSPRSTATKGKWETGLMVTSPGVALPLQWGLWQEGFWPSAPVIVCKD